MSGQAGLASQVRRGLAWSAMSNLVLRVGSLALGIILARLLTPEQFGVYAVALTVQTVLMTLADMGMSADLVRASDPERRAPTVASLGLVSGTAMAAVGVVTAAPLASLLGSPASAPAIAVLSGTLVLAGAGVVPFAFLQRRFQQRKLFAIAVVDFIVSTGVTLVLIAAGWGVMSLAAGRIAAQAVSLILQFRMARLRPRFGWATHQAGSVLGFGVPVAAANLLSWTLLSIDNVVIARVAGPVSLGFYVLAFNISTWPMTAIGQVVRSVALPAFTRMREVPNDRSFTDALSLTWAFAVPAGGMLAALAVPLIHLVYGARWSPAAPVLAALGLFGAVRVAFDLMASYLLAHGASRAVLGLQVLWFVTLVPAMVVGTRLYGITGGGWAHVAVAVLVTLPAYLWALQRVGAPIPTLLHVTWPPVAAAVPSCLLAAWASGQLGNGVAGLLVGGLSGLFVYTLVLFVWARHRLRDLTSARRPEPQTQIAPAITAQPPLEVNP